MMGEQAAQNALLPRLPMHVVQSRDKSWPGKPGLRGIFTLWRICAADVP